MSSDRETKKTLVKRTATVAAALSGAGTLSPLAGELAGRAFEAISKSNRRRVDELLEYALRGDDAEELAARLNKAFIEEDPEVIATFIQAARAAMEAFEPAVVALDRAALAACDRTHPRAPTAVETAVVPPRSSGTDCGGVS